MIVAEQIGQAQPDGDIRPVRAPEEDPVPLRRAGVRVDPRRLAGTGGFVIAVMAVATFVVVYLVGPLVHERDQHTLLAVERVAIANAARDDQGLYRPTLPVLPPTPGAAVGILAIPAVGIQQAVVEGVAPAQTIAGPGHVPGTAGLGQPGNSVVVGRRSGFGGPFGDLGALKAGDKVVTATLEGQSIYVVRSVRTVRIVTSGTPATAPTLTAGASSSSTQSTASTTTTLKAPAGARNVGGRPSVPTVDSNEVFGPTSHNQITLVTSGSTTPWNTSTAVVVVARLDGLPFTPVPQESRSLSEQGTGGDPGALAWLLLDLLVLGAVVVGAVALYRRTTLRTAYVLSTAPLVVFTILGALAVSRLFPAWL